MMSDEWPGQRLHQYAIFDNNESMIDILQGEEQKNINAPDRWGRTAVYTAVSNNSIKCLEILLQHGADPSIAGGEKVRNQTPLHQALLDGKVDAVTLLLEYGADLNCIDESGLSPINLSKSIGDDKYIRIFKQEDERRRQNALEVVIDLCEASENGDLTKVKDILKLPAPTGWELANMSVPNDPSRTPLSVATKKGDVAIMDELLSTVSVPKHSPSLIHVAVEADHVEIVKMLLQRYPDCCNNEDEGNQTPLHLASQIGSLDIVKCLLEWNYPESMYTPVYIEDDSIEYKRVILVNRTQTEGKTALFLACEFGHETVVEYLLNYAVKGSKVEKDWLSGRTVGDRGSVTSNHSSGSESVSGNGADVDVKPVNVELEGNQSIVLNVDKQENSVHYRPVRLTQTANYALSSIYIAVKNGFHNIVDKLAKAGSSLNLRFKENGIEYSLLLLLAFKNNDFLMLDKLLQHNVEDLDNHVLQEAVRTKPAFIPHFLKFKASEDKQNNINKSVMKKEFAQLNQVSSENLDDLLSHDPRFIRIFPTHPVNIRWQNLKILSAVEEAWLTIVVNKFNSAMTNVNARIPLFAITRVDVSHNNITMMPTSLLQLPSLSVLIASNNQISEFPLLRSFSLDCRCLEELNIHNNKLTIIPEYMFTLPCLRSVNASNNKICELPSSIWQARSLKVIDLSHNELQKLPSPIWSLLSGRKESETENDSMVEQSSFGDMNDLPNSIADHVMDHQLKRVNHWTGNLEISDEDVKATEDRYKGIKILKLGHNKIKVFPEFLSCCCPQLDTLEMEKNELRHLGNLAAYPKLLKTLDLSHNRIENMADWQTEEEPGKSFCANLKTHRNSMSSSTDLSNRSFVGASAGQCGHRRHLKLENLETLDLSSNKLASLAVLREAKTNTSFLNSTQNLSLGEKEIEEQDLQGKLLFPNLTSLNVDMNQLSCLPSDIGELKVLKIFSLKRNTRLRELPVQLGLLEKLQRMEVDLCPIEGPIQDVIKGASNRASDITGFLRSVLEESEQYNCMNLMIVGSFNIGKTSLLEELAKKGERSGKRTHFNQRQDKAGVGTTKDGKPLSTVGIDISQLVLTGKQGRVEFRTWDFAGQKEYYATHQYFLSPRSLYLVVWNLKDGEPGVKGLRQWLVNIQAQAPGAPVIIVGTHLDEITGTNKKNYTKDWVESMAKQIRDRYMKWDGGSTGLPRVIDVISLAAGKRPKNIDKLKNKIYDVVFTLNHPARKNERLLGHKVPKKYIKLQTCIQTIVRERNEQNKEPVLDSNSYLLNVMTEMMKDGSTVGFRNKEDLYQATRFLHENGVLCHFQDTSLKDQYFLDPQWLCDQLAKVVSIQEVQKYSKQGVMKVQDLKRLYQNSDKIGQYILSLLNKFEVALQFDGEHLLLPSLLPTAESLDPAKMREIPVKRRGINKSLSLNQSINSVKSFGLSMFDKQTTSTSAGEMFIANSISVRNPVFSNTRLYLLTYFPSGFWPRLISRLLADQSFYEPLIQMFPFPQEIMEKCSQVRKATPMWRCWQTGLELVYFDNVIMQVKEVQTADQYAQGMCNYDVEGLNLECFFEDQWGELDIDDSAILEISFQADHIDFNFGFQESREQCRFQSIESKQIYHDEKAKASILAKVVEHVDALLQDWYPEIGESRFLQNCKGRYLVTRVIPCPLCLQSEISHVESAPESFMAYSGKTDIPQLLSISSNNAAPAQSEVVEGNAKDDSAKRVIYTFLVEKCIKNVLEGIDEMCKVHGSVSPQHMPTEDGTIRVLHVAPDVVFQDLDERFVAEDDSLQVCKKLGRGAFGTVSAGKLKRGENTTFDVAVKVLYDHRDKDRRKQPSQMSLETVCAAYMTARQEISILLAVEHPHIVPLLGLSRRPLALLLSLAPLGSLTDTLESRHKDGLRLPVWVIKQIVIQTADALDYLHRQSIIYRDLKSDNVLVWKIPGPTDFDPRQAVMVKLADYGISRPVMQAGAKGFGGTPPFIAPEILIHAGKDTYTNKVDIFSFGMFLFELLTCRMPLAEINNPTVHVCHGGRPTITNEEAVYPSHLLDLMTVCWGHDPQNRPSAEQVCTIASSPQFCHLSDVVSMETESVVLSACTVYTEHNMDGVDHTQVWIASQLGDYHNVEILSYNRNNKCISHKELQQDSKILAVCNVNNRVWCLDANGVIHVYSSTTLDKQMSYQLPVSHSIFLVYSMTYHHGDDGHVVIIFRECKENATTLFSFNECVLDSDDCPVPVKIPRECFCAAIVKSNDSLKIWLGSTDGEIMVRCVQGFEKNEQRLSPHNDPSKQRCIFIATPLTTHLSHAAWSYNYPGSRVFRWDTDKEVVVATLDCSNLIPTTDSTYRSQKAPHFEANHYQVTALSAVDQYLYVSTTWGCIVVANAQSLQPLSVFRCHGNQDFYCKSILPLGPIGLMERDCDHDQSEVLYSKSDSVNQGTSIKEGYDRGVVTIGRGYVDIINHVTQLEKQVFLREDSEEGFAMVGMGSAPTPRDRTKSSSSTNAYILSWIAKHWEFY